MLCSQPARELSPQGTARSKKMYHRVQRTRLRRPAMTRLNLPKPYSLPPDCVGSRERDSPEVTCVKGQRPKPTDKRGETSKLSREVCSLRLACICFPCSLRHAAQNRSILEPVKELRNLVLSHCYSRFPFFRMNLSRCSHRSNDWAASTPTSLIFTRSFYFLKRNN